jgi:hypothetical protein
VLAPEPAQVFRVWAVPHENRFESIVKKSTPFTQKTKWGKARVESEDGWISLRPRPEHEQAAIAASGIDTILIEEERPRSAHEWAERVRQSLEKAESAPRIERLKDIQDSLDRLSFFRRPLD